MEKKSELDKCKAFLCQRMIFATTSSIIVQLILISGVILITNLRILHGLEGIQNIWNLITSLSIYAYYFIFSIVLVGRGIICSKAYMNPIVYDTSRFSKFCRIFTPHNLLVGSVHILLGALVVWLHLSFGGSRSSRLITSCTKLQGYCLDEEHYFLLLKGFSIGLYWFINSNYRGFKNVQFSIIPQSKLSQIKSGIQAMIANTFLDALWPTIYFFSFYSVFGNYCRNFITSPFSLSIEEMPLDKLSRLLNLYLIFYAWLHTVVFIIIIQSMDLIFQAYLTEWIPFDIERSQYTEISNTLSHPELTDALTGERIPILQQLGYLDLVTIAQKDRIRRTLLFTLSQPGGHPYNWNSAVEKSLSLIRKFSAGLDSACSTQKDQIPQLMKTAPVSSIQVPDKFYTYHMRSLVSPMATSTLSVNNEESKQTTDNFITLYYKNMKKNLVNYLLSKRLISYIFAEQFENKLKHVLIDAQVVIWAADAISSLAAVSLTEDPYGIVQKDLPEIIEVLLKLKQSLDKLQKMNMSIRKPASDDRFLKQILTALRSAVRRSLYRIVSHFRKHLDDLPLAPLAIDQLQPFFMYKE